MDKFVVATLTNTVHQRAEDLLEHVLNVLRAHKGVEVVECERGVSRWPPAPKYRCETLGVCLTLKRVVNVCGGGEM